MRASSQPAVRRFFDFLRIRGFSPEVVSGPRAFGPFSLSSGISLSSALLQDAAVPVVRSSYRLSNPGGTNAPQQARLYHRNPRRGTTKSEALSDKENCGAGVGSRRQLSNGSWR